MIKQINIFGYSYPIDQSKTNDEIGAYGRYHSRLQKIQIANDLSESQKESTLLHEVLHLISFHLRLDLSENQVAGLEAGLYEFLQSNDIFSLNKKPMKNVRLVSIRKIESGE